MYDFHVSEQNFNLNYVLSQEEKENFICDCEVLATELLGPANPLVDRDERGRRLSNGLKVFLARTAIRCSAEQVGFMLEIEIFISDVEVEPDPEEAIKEFSGSYLAFDVDLIDRTIKRTEARGNLSINFFGEDDLSLTALLAGESTDDEEYEEDDEFDSMFSDDNLEASDYLELNDIRPTFFGS